jgi:chemotaxis protein MotB
MSRKKKHEHVNHERWLVSYADFITLLFAFFVVLFASGQADKKKEQKFASAIQQAFSQMALFPPHSKEPALNDGAGANPNAPPKPVELPLEADGEGDSPQRMRDDLRQRVEKIVAESTAKKAGLKPGDLTMRVTSDGLVLSLHEGGFFDSGSAELRPQAVETLRAIAAQLPVTGDIRVEGHTDNVPMHSALYASNWELSSVRASAIARFLLEHSMVNPSYFAVAGYAEFHPVASNATAEGRAQNRRVDIVFMASKP